MTLIKKSARTLRDGCKKCGSTEVYWAHDDERPGKVYVMVDANVITRGIKQGQAVPQHYLHSCFTASSPMDNQTVEVQVSSTTVLVDGEEGGDIITHETSPVSAASLTSTPDDLASALDVLRRTLAPQIDRAEVEKIAREIIAGVVYPTRTVVIRDTEKIEIEGIAHWRLATVTKLLSMGHHVFMVGPAGSGKSSIARQAAEALGLVFYAMSCYPQMPPSAIVGYKDANGNFHGTMFTKAWTFGGVMNIDELDNSHSSTINALNEALSNGHMAINGEMVARHPDFRIVATGNTFGRGADRMYVGRQAIDVATLDRFRFVEIDYDEALESAVCHATGASAATVDKVLKFVRKLRHKVYGEKMPVVVSPRGSKAMCEMLHHDFSWDEAVDMAIRKGTSDDMWEKMNAA